MYLFDLIQLEPDSISDFTIGLFNLKGGGEGSRLEAIYQVLSSQYYNKLLQLLDSGSNEIFLSLKEITRSFYEKCYFVSGKFSIKNEAKMFYNVFFLF